MNKLDRHRYILDLIESDGRVSVSEISARIHVSEMTVRRDLEALEQAGMLARVHGGAVTTQSRSYEPGFHGRSLRNEEAKTRIGHAAADLLREGETVIIDGGTTTLKVAEALRCRRNLRVLALNLRIADVLADDPGITVMLPGGIVRPHERSLVGGLTEAAFRDLFFDTLVLSAGGVSATAGVTEYVPDDAETKRAAVASARRRILVADSTKLDQVAFARVCAISDVDTLVTDGEHHRATVDELRAGGLNVEVV